MSERTENILTLGVVLRRDEPPGPGERRFLRAIADDARIRLVWVADRTPTADSRPTILALEACAFPTPDRAPEMPRLPGRAPCPVDVVVDFSHGPDAEKLGLLGQFGLWRLSSYAPGAGWSEARDLAPHTRAYLTSVYNGFERVVASARYEVKFLATWNQSFQREKSIQLLHRELGRLAVTRDMSWSQRTKRAQTAFEPLHQPGYVARALTEMGLRAARKIGAKLGTRPGMFYLRLADGSLQDMDLSSGIDILPPMNTYWADPFLFERDGELFIFYEVFDYDTNLGHLAVGVVDGDRVREIGPVLNKELHRSFPFVFEWEGAVYMLPEVNAGRRIELWRATDFPTGWELVSTAFEGQRAADSVMFEKDGQWWLMTNLCNDSFGDFGSELHLFAIDSPLMNFVTPHPLNPVVIDSCTARGGGRVMSSGGRLLRLSQDNSNGVYGYGLNVMEITALSMTDYSERRRAHFVPDDEPSIMGVHHFDAAGGRFVYDVRRPFWQPLGLRRGQYQHPTAQEN